MVAGQDTQHVSLTRRKSLDETLMMNDASNDVAEGTSKGLNPRPLLRVVGRNIFLILGFTAAVGGFAAYKAATAPQVYEGGFQILVEPITSQARSADPSAISRDGAAESNSVDYPTLLQVLQSPELLSKIAAQVRTRYPSVTAGTLAQAIANQDLVIERIGTTMLDSTRTINVTYKGFEPDQVRFILEKMAEGYLRFSLEDRRNRIGGGVQFIEDQLPALQQRVNSLEAQVQALRQRYRLVDPETEGGELATQFREVQAQRLEAQRQLREQTTLYGTIVSQLGVPPNQALAAAALTQNPQLQDILKQLKQVEGQIAVKLARFNEQSPVIQGLREQQRNLTQLVLQEARTNLGLGSSNVGVSPQVLAYQDSIRLDLIKQLVEASNTGRVLQVRSQEIARTEAFLDQQLRQVPAITRQYNDLQQQLDIATKTLNQFLLQRETLRVEAAQKEVPWEIISKPSIVTDEKGEPAASNKQASRFLLMGLFGGLFLGLVAALIKEKISNVFYVPEDLKDAVPAPFLGVLPLERGLRQPSHNGSTKALSNPFSDSLSSIYTNLRFLNPDTSIRSLVVSSVGLGDGKTTVALNLAKTAAAMGQRVLLVDANLCNPELHNLLGLQGQRGLTDVLAGSATLTDVIQHPPLDEKLAILTAGQISSGSTRLIASNQMQDVVQRSEEEFDLVIYDAPPFQGLTETNFLVAQTDGVLMVVGLNKTKRSALMRILDDLKKFHLPVVGVVANHVDRSRAGARTTPSPQTANNYAEHPAFLGNLKT